MKNIEQVRTHLKAHPVVALVVLALAALFWVPLAVTLAALALVVLIAPVVIRRHAPELATTLAVESLQAQTLRVVQTVWVVMADEILLKSQAEREAFHAKTWEHRATKALLRNDEAEAGRCVERKQHHEANRARLLEELTKQQAAVGAMRPTVDSMRAETHAASQAGSLLAVRARRANARRDVVLTASGLKTQAGEESFQRFADEVARTEAEAEALEDLLGADRAAAADQHSEAWARTERAEAVAAELEALRRRVGLRRKALGNGAVG
jgi:phage shock protein A